MRRRSVLAICTVALSAVFCIIPASAWSASTGNPFAIASVGPNAGSRIDATVTRTVNGVAVTLPAAMVPALTPGDVVDVRFPDYTRPPAIANYHVNAAFITETAPQRWLYEKSGAWDRLFSNVRGKRRTPFVPQPLHFVYGVGDHLGIPVIFIVPEDAKTRGMDGVRDYVDAHPTDFKNMADSANDAVAKYSWFRDFLQSLAQGSLDPVTGQQRIQDVAVALGAPSADIQACYSTGGTQAQIASCIQTSLLSVQYQTNIQAPTIAQFYGGVAGAALPAQVAFYLEPLLAIWQVFSRLGHQEYEYLPAALVLTAPPAHSNAAPTELLVGAKVPTLRPPGAQSSVLFFTIGDAQAAQNPPHVVDDAPATGVCARTARVSLPLHLDQTSPYVNDTKVLIQPDEGKPFSLPLDPRTLAAPTVERTRLERGGAETIRLVGRYGFDPLEQEPLATARVAFPNHAQWSLAAFPHQPAISGRQLDVIVTSAAAPCLSTADLQIGSAAPIPLTVKALDDRHVELTASLENVPPGEASLRFHQVSPIQSALIEDDATLAIEPTPAQVGGAPTAHLGDRFVSLSGSGFESVEALRLAGLTYRKDPGSTADRACFTGPPLGGKSLQTGQAVSAQLLGPGGVNAQAFVVQIGPPRPVVTLSTTESTPAARWSNEPLEITLRADGPLPLQYQVRLRQSRANETPCDAVADAPTGAAVPAASIYPVDNSTLAVDARPDDLLGDRAFGSLQAQLVDAQANTTSAWIDLPGTFVRTPTVVRIDCPSDPAAPCTLVGTNLFAINGVEDAAGNFVTPTFHCTSSMKGQDCAEVPHLAHYTLRLNDAGAILQLPDVLIATAASSVRSQASP